MPARSRSRAGSGGSGVSYRPPARPAWLDEVNAFGRTLGDPRALVALDADGMVAAACELTNLDDFGDDEWRAPYSTFVQSLESEGNLHLLGRLMARNEIMRSLRNRLQVIDTERRHLAIGARGYASGVAAACLRPRDQVVRRAEGVGDAVLAAVPHQQQLDVGQRLPATGAGVQ